MNECEFGSDLVRGINAPIDIHHLVSKTGNGYQIETMGKPKLEARVNSVFLQYPFAFSEASM